MQLVDRLFVTDKKKESAPVEEKQKEVVELEESVDGEIGKGMESEIFSLKEGYGFITYPPNNLSFQHTNVKNVRFEDLLEGDSVECVLTHSGKGRLVAQVVCFLGELEGEDEVAESE